MPPTVSPAALRRCDPAIPVATLNGTALGTSWRVRFADRGQAARDALRDAIGRRLDRIVAEMSQWEPASLLSRFNRADAGAWFALPPDFARVLRAAAEVAERSGGAFDPTHGRIAALMGYGAETIARRPSPTEMEEAFLLAGWRRLAFDAGAGRVRQPGGLWLDLSGIGKGFAVDAVADLLAAEGIADALVEIGGELAGRGLRPDGQPWWVDLESPGEALPVPLRIGLHEQAVATSGDYVRGAHTIDPRTGRPRDGRIASVSVLHASAMLADAWATAFTVLGADAALALAAREGIAMRIVERAGSRLVERFSPRLLEMMAE